MVAGKLGDIVTTSLASAHLDRRRRAHDVLSARLGALSDDHLAALVPDTDSGRVNIHGNQSAVIDVDGAKVFVKKIALTDLERAAEGATANLFDLPLFYHYGVGSAGFGAWRELSAYLRGGAWALSGECPHFPLVYHWRVLPRTVTSPLPAELQARLERGIALWEHSDAIRARLDAIHAASASIVLFLEHVPETLFQWLKARPIGQRLDAAMEAAILRVHDQWRDAAAFMNDRGMLHFDLHRHNVLTDGGQIYVADFGLALCADFDFSPDERSFFETHRLYDRCYVEWAFTEWLAAEAEPPPVLTPALSALADRCTPTAGVLGAFIGRLIRESKSTPYPAAELKAALGALSG